MPMRNSIEQLTSKLTAELAADLTNKYLMFDTCVISTLTSLKSESPTKEIFDFLNEIKCVPGISEHIYVECLRGQQSVIFIGKTKEFLSKFSRRRLAENQVPEFHEKMISVDRINQKYGINGKQASYVDITTSVFLQQWPNDLFLATFNIKDFCPKIFKLVSIIPLILSHKLQLLGIIQADKEAFREEKNNL